jgi:ubiquitin-protein ligase
MDSGELNGITAIVDDNDLFHWTGFIVGQPGTLYEGGQYEVRIRIVDNYPMRPPIVTFITPIQHVNVALGGAICLDILSSKWAPTLSIRTILLSIQQMLESPNIEDPLNTDLAHMYSVDPEGYKKFIRDSVRRQNE